jgi:glucans biosynthesis protein
MPPWSRGALRFMSVLAAMAAPAAQGFDFDDVARQAQKLASAPFEKPAFELPKPLADLNYDQYRDIRFRPSRAVWRDRKLPFELQFLHLGQYFNLPVKVNVVSAAGFEAIVYDPDQFDYGRNKIDPAILDKAKLGFAGFRIHYPVNVPTYKDEVAVFVGASYFRAVGKGQHYGLSARGLAIDTGAMSGEEFPRFTEYWIQKPAPRDRQIVVYALLDSKRATGAYRFEIRPGAETRMDVRARLYLREPVGKLGLAPLNSMFDYGENQAPSHDDYRPEVHDSDGLLVRTSGDEWIWRPLVNPKRLLDTSFAMTNPRGFGLLQRDRMFAHYEDLESRYDQRPSGWVEPKGDWGAGRVELVEIPSPDETHDNIAAFWVPDATPSPGQPLDLQYTLSWQLRNPTASSIAWIAQSRRGHGYRVLQPEDDSLLFVVDFDGPAAARLPDRPALEAAVTVDDNGELLERVLYPNDGATGWRLALRMKRKDKDKPVEMRASLKVGDKVVSETWSYILPPS